MSGFGVSSLLAATFFACDIVIEKLINNSLQESIASYNLVWYYQVPELKIVESLDISLLCYFLINVQLPPEVIYTPHIQDLVCIDLPCVAATKTSKSDLS